jgi:hypothetical protein
MLVAIQYFHLAFAEGGYHCGILWACTSDEDKGTLCGP